MMIMSLPQLGLGCLRLDSLFLPRAQVQFLVGKLRSHKLCGTATKMIELNTKEMQTAKQSQGGWGMGRDSREKLENPKQGREIKFFK